MFKRMFPFKRKDITCLYSFVTVMLFRYLIGNFDNLTGGTAYLQQHGKDKYAHFIQICPYTPPPQFGKNPCHPMYPYMNPAGCRNKGVKPSAQNNRQSSELKLKFLGILDLFRSERFRTGAFFNSAEF